MTASNLYIDPMFTVGAGHDVAAPEPAPASPVATLQATGERQVGATLDKIAPDHRMRYEYAARRIMSAYCGEQRPVVLDAGCGNGYGASILADAGCEVVAVDASRDAIAFAQAHYDRSTISWRVADLLEGDLPPVDAIVCFEVLEHVNAVVAVARFAALAPVMFCSVPNQLVVPYTPETHPFHLRHYTPDEFRDLLAVWVIADPCSQADKWKGDIAPGWDGRTLIATCFRRGDENR